jgi:hypothetical protein
MRTKILIAVLLALALLTVFVKREFSYNSKWDEIHIAMSRQEVHKIIGEGVAEWSEWKPSTYRDSSGLFIWHKLTLDYGKCPDWTPEKGGWMAQGGCVHNINVERFIGEHHPLEQFNINK